MTIAAIFADWGTTNRRAWAVDRDGKVVDHRHDQEGLLGVQDRAFKASFGHFVGDWLASSAATVPVLMGGMVGSKLGWQEVPYLATPVALSELPAQLARLPDLGTHPVRIVPGLSSRIEGRPDVVRGEECQIYGLWLRDRSDRLCVLPGTHSKWCEIAGGRVTGFRTYMTGELFAQLTGSGTLAQLMRADAPHDAEAFRLGLTASAEISAGGLLNRLFSVRTLGLFGELPPEALASYLSGILIGSELRDATSRSTLDGKLAIAVVGAPKMTGLYVDALKELSIEAEAVEGDALFRAALHHIAVTAKLI
ncbi:MAG TPA: 2-dehydro-3-deoxygalactonokinase [Dongiaceae bacterium]